MYESFLRLQREVANAKRTATGDMGQNDPSSQGFPDQRTYMVTTKAPRRKELNINANANGSYGQKRSQHSRKVHSDNGFQLQGRHSTE